MTTISDHITRALEDKETNESLKQDIATLNRIADELARLKEDFIRVIDDNDILESDFFADGHGSMDIEHAGRSIESLISYLEGRLYL